MLVLAFGLVACGLSWSFAANNPLPGVSAFAGGLVVLGGVMQMVLGVDKRVPAPEDLPDPADETPLSQQEIAYLRGQMRRALTSWRDLTQLASWVFIIFGGLLGVIAGIVQAQVSAR